MTSSSVASALRVPSSVTSLDDVRGVRPPVLPRHTSFEQAFAIAETLHDELATTAVDRDRAGGHPAPERERIRASGLLRQSIPVDYGGDGGSWHDVFRVVRRIAVADSAVAHLLGFHHLQIAGVLLYGSEAQRARFLTRTVYDHLFWGNALNPLDHRAIATAVDGGYRIDGIKSFCSGSVGSDMLTFSAWYEPTQTNLIAALPTGTRGITVDEDWDAFGQRQTDSGTVRFDGVRLSSDDVLLAPSAVATSYEALRSCVAQLSMTNLYAGIAQGAFDAARGFILDEARPWFASGVGSVRNDPFIQHRWGELHLLLRPALTAADAAAQALDIAFARGRRLSPEHRAEVAVAVAEAKVLSHRAAIEIASQLFELTGPRATSARYGFDRFWRNARVHTLHDPIDYKLRDLGRWALEGRAPEPTPYS